MKKFILISVVFVGLTVAQGQTPNWQWAKQSKSFISVYGLGVCTDQNGNVFVTGYFMNESATFGMITLYKYSQYGDNMFIVKYDKNGNVLWAEGAKGASHAASISLDVTGNIFVTGFGGGD